MLGYNEIDDLMDLVIDNIRERIYYSNRIGEIEEYLEGIGMGYLSSFNQGYKTYKAGKIVVLGASSVSVSDLENVVIGLGLDKDRFEFNLNYNKLKNYNYKKLRNNPNYRVALLGPMPHSTTGKSKSGSAIEELKKNTSLRVEKLTTSNELKITQSNFKQTLEMLIKEDYI